MKYNILFYTSIFILFSTTASGLTFKEFVTLDRKEQVYYTIGVLDSIIIDADKKNTKRVEFAEKWGVTWAYVQLMSFYQQDPESPARNSFNVALILSMKISHMASKATDKVLIDYFKAQAILTNKQLPKMIDEMTKFEKITVGSDLNIKYTYSFPKYSSSDFDSEGTKEMVANLKPELVKELCSNKLTRLSVVNGGVFSYVYFGNDGREITQINIDQNSCNLAK